MGPLLKSPTRTKTRLTRQTKRIHSPLKWTRNAILLLRLNLIIRKVNLDANLAKKLMTKNKKKKKNFFGCFVFNYYIFFNFIFFFLN